MHINVGDKLVVTKNVSGFFNDGDIVEVTNVNENIVSFACYNADTESHVHITRSGQMDIDTCNQYFTKLQEEKEEIEIPTITEEYIEEIMENSAFDVRTVFGKCTIVTCKLPNGFVIVESSACVSPENYDKQIGMDICMKKIRDKIWELEGYRLQQYLWEEENSYCPWCCGECEECDECLDTDLDCDDCKDYNCEYNPNYNVI